MEHSSKGNEMELITNEMQHSSNGTLIKKEHSSKGNEMELITNEMQHSSKGTLIITHQNEMELLIIMKW